MSLIEAPVRNPKQARSQKTLDRILRATERLLHKQSFDEIGVQQIVRASRTSVGAFYTRFRDKQGLLSALYEHYDQGLDGEIEAWCHAHGPAPEDLAGSIRWFLSYLIEAFRSRRHLLRALALHVRCHPEEIDDLRRDRRAFQHRFLFAALLARREEIRHPDPERAIENAIFCAASTLRERVLFSETAHASAMVTSDAELAEDLERMLMGLLA